MREDAGEQQVTAVCHDVLEDIRMAALDGDRIWGEVFNFVQSPQAVQEDMHRARQIRGDLVNGPKNQMDNHETKELASIASSIRGVLDEGTSQASPTPGALKDVGGRIELRVRVLHVGIIRHCHQGIVCE
jgi:hypothetical protein